jgi:hypothetical protein
METMITFLRAALPEPARLALIGSVMSFGAVILREAVFLFRPPLGYTRSKLESDAFFDHAAYPSLK